MGPTNTTEPQHFMAAIPRSEQGCCDSFRRRKARDVFSLLRMTHTGFQEFRTNFYELIHRGGISENLKEEFLVHDGDGKGGALRHLDATRAADGSRTLWTVSQILNHLDLIFLDPNRGSKARDAYSLLRMTHTGFQEFRTNFYELIHSGGISENLKEEFYKKLPQEFLFVPGALPFSVFALARVHEEIGSCSAAASASWARVTPLSR
ncbi:hypothetical protein E4U23_000627 [Claviceps purpurea]|nr:hypothetical protein E4U23_000627 [Claviceps purpurea]